MTLLVLFDVDGTLLLSDGAGRSAMESAGQELFGDHFSCERIAFAGMLDTVIWQQLCRHNDVHDDESRHARFRERYADQLTELLSVSERCQPLPGVVPLVDALERHDDVVLGLLSGNYAETGRLKVDAAGLRSERFRVSAWGSDALRREDLVPVALRRYADVWGDGSEPSRVVIVGDTPADVACAHAHGFRCLAVATGFNAADELWRSGADLVVETLDETERLLEWLAS